MIVALQWTVNGELRVGFFSKKAISKGEEITFDYKYERYGQEAQKCFCGSSKCRGWLGGDPDQDKKEPDEDDDDDEDYWSTSDSEDEADEEKDQHASLEPVSRTAPTPAGVPQVQLETGGVLPSSKPATPSRRSSIQQQQQQQRSDATKVGRRRRRKKRRSPRKIKNYEDDEVNEFFYHLSSGFFIN